MLPQSGKWGSWPQGVAQGAERKSRKKGPRDKASKAPKASATTKTSSRAPSRKAPQKRGGEVRMSVGPDTRHHWHCWLEDAQLYGPEELALGRLLGRGATDPVYEAR